MSFVSMFTRRRGIAILAALFAGLAAWSCAKPRLPSDAEIKQAYARPVPPPNDAMRVFHLGHSLVGRDMPAMLAQLAPGHRYESQLGWGTSLKQHWEPGETINGFDTENAHPNYRDARDAIGSTDYDAVILTEMVEIRDAIKYHDSTTYTHQWADLAQQNPKTRVYIYETWHRLDDKEGWLNRLDKDLSRYWEAQLALPHLSRAQQPVYIIPAGQVMAAFARALQDSGRVDGVRQISDLFARTETGEVDQIHVNDLGAYLVALTHYAVLYQRSPVGLPHRLLRADGTDATAPGANAARLMQETVWQVVQNYPKSGVAQ